MRKPNSKPSKGKARPLAPAKGDKRKLKPPPEEHPIAQTLDVFLHKCEDIKLAVQSFVPMAEKYEYEREKKLVQEFKDGYALLAKNDSSYAEGIRQTQNASLLLDHLRKSNLPNVVESSLFLKLFSAFDAFTGNLLMAIYKRKPELFETISKEVKVSEILKFKSFENLQDVILREEIENFRRNSYVEQFKELENTFGLKLRVFEKWPSFVECSQRRNLFTHCDGQVSQQYLDVCDKEGYKFKKRPELGHQLKLGPNYFLPACDLVAEVAVKLCHTLWRKIFPDELQKADEELVQVTFDRLQFGEYDQAHIYASFGLSQPKCHSDLHRRVVIVNYAIALKFGGKPAEAQAILKQQDWTSCSADIKIAEAVLSDKFDEAAKLMKKIGKEGEIITEQAYHTWPLFKFFRTSTPFLKTYEEVYGRPFIVELQKVADKSQLPSGENNGKT